MSSADGEKLRKLQAQSKAAADILFRKKRDLQHAATDVEEVRASHTYIHAYIHTYIHAYMDAYIHTYICIHTYTQPAACSDLRGGGARIELILCVCITI